MNENTILPVDDDFMSVPDKDEPSFRWTLKKEKFCYHYARMGNCGTAGKAAGFSHETYGSELLLQKPIRDRVQKEIRNVLRAEGENEDSVIARWARWADADIGDYFTAGWELRDIDALSENARKCIKKVKITHNQYGRNIDFELYDAPAANIHLATMMGMLQKDDGAGQSAEEQAKSIKQMLQEMNDINGLTEPALEGSARGESQTTH